MSTPAETPTPAPKVEKKRKSTKLPYLLCGLVGIFLMATLYRGDWRQLPVETMATNRMHQRITREFVSKADEIDNTANFTEAARKLEDLKVESSHKRNLVDNFHRNCPETDGWKGGRLDLVLVGCDAGKDLWILPPDRNEFNSYTFSATLFKNGDAGKLVQVTIKPVVKVRNPNDGFSKVEEVSPSGSVSPIDYRVRGKVKFVTLGADADVLVLELKP